MHSLLLFLWLVLDLTKASALTWIISPFENASTIQHNKRKCFTPARVFPQTFAHETEEEEEGKKRSVNAESSTANTKERSPRPIYAKLGPTAPSPQCRTPRSIE